jgi:glycosyltransferase involved in cell wall biosynthesis
MRETVETVSETRSGSHTQLKLGVNESGGRHGALKVLHVIPSLALAHGGPSVALPLMAKSLAGMGIEVDVATTDDDGRAKRLRVPLGQRVERDRCGIFYFRKQTEFYKVSFPLRHWLKRYAAEYDLVHIHALFSFASTVAARAAKRAGVPYIIRPLGVLNDWGVKNRRPWLKALSLKFVEGAVLRNAAAMHYTSEQERVEAERIGATAPAAVIPLQIDTEPFKQLPPAAAFFKDFPGAAGKRVLLFLSRLDPKKGLEMLFAAYAEVCGKHADVILVIAGSGEKDYEALLRERTLELRISDKVIWTGFLSCDRKLAALSAAEIFVFPSRSENFGIALVEAMAAGKACLTTTSVGIAPQIKEAEAGMVVPAEAGPLAKAIEVVLQDGRLREQLAIRARQLVAEKFSGEAIGSRLCELYHEVATQPTRALRKT